MWSILGELLVGIFDFVLDVLLFRRLRRDRGLRQRDMSEDASEVARFDFFTLTPIALACSGLMLLLIFGLGVPMGWSVAIGVTAGVVWGTWRYFQLVREP